MKALFVREPGSPPEFEIRDVPEPSARAGQVVVRVEAAGLCGHDIAIMTGLLRRGVDLDVILGHEISGRIAQAGEGVDGLSVGDPVVTSLTAFCGECDRCGAGLDYRCRFGRGVGHGLNGGFAEYVRLPSRSVTRIPQGIDMAGAALLACPIGVCVRAVSIANIQSGEVGLVSGAGGGLGVHALQVVSAMGSQVFAATSSPEKLDALERFAPGSVILGGELDFSELVLAFTEDEGADVVIDTVGSATFESSLRSLAQYGRMVLLGEVAGGRARVGLTDIMFRDAAIRGSTGASLGDIQGAIELVESGQVEPVVYATLPIEEAAEAVRMVTSREALGRVVLTP
ncbi:MAG: alcohol dehydrogenase catalytic domain-containing protein [Dehalococcoidia bacterium]|nr:alcohol dehydrogenase catalytic domain-containing protein [Dehalococcoidia bacterium]